MLIDRLQGNPEPGVFLDGTPAREAKTAARSQSGGEVRERGYGVAEEHHSETRSNQFGVQALKGEFGGVPEETVGINECVEPLPCNRKHRFGNIDSDQASGGANGAREFQSQRPTAAANLDYGQFRRLARRMRAEVR